jgi:hypothetical protein
MSDPQAHVPQGDVVHRSTSLMHVAIHRDAAVASQPQRAVADRCRMTSAQKLEASDEDVHPAGHVAGPGRRD